MLTATRCLPSVLFVIAALSPKHGCILQQVMYLPALYKLLKDVMGRAMRSAQQISPFSSISAIVSEAFPASAGRVILQECISKQHV